MISLDRIRKNFLNNFSAKQIVLKNTFWLIIADGFTKGVGFLLAVLIARRFGPAIYGTWAFAFSFVVFFVIMADFGLSTLMIREVARDIKLASKYVSNINLLKILLGTITFILIIITAQFLGKGGDVKLLIYLAGVYTIINTFNDFYRSIFRAFEQMQYEAYSKIINGVLLFLFVGSLIFFKFPITYLLIGYIVSVIINLVITLFFAQKNFLKINIRASYEFIRKILKEAWPLAVIGLLGSIYFQLDTVQVSLIAGDFETGVYSVAYNIIFALMSVLLLIYSALYPTLSRIYGESKQKFYINIKLLAKKLTLYSFALCLIVFIFAKPIILTLYGAEYNQSIIILKILTISVFIMFFATSYTQSLIIINKQKEYAKIQCIAVLFNFLLNFIFIHYWGAIGAATSTLFSSFAAMILFIKKLNMLKKNDLANEQGRTI